MTSSTFPLLALPLDLRLVIYDLYHPKASEARRKPTSMRIRPLSQVNRQLRKETLQHYFGTRIIEIREENIQNFFSRMDRQVLSSLKRVSVWVHWHVELVKEEGSPPCFIDATDYLHRRLRPLVVLSQELGNLKQVDLHYLGFRGLRSTPLVGGHSPIIDALGFRGLDSFNLSVLDQKWSDYGTVNFERRVSPQELELAVAELEKAVLENTPPSSPDSDKTDIGGSWYDKVRGAAQRMWDLPFHVQVYLL